MIILGLMLIICSFFSSLLWSKLKYPNTNALNAGNLWYLNLGIMGALLYTLFQFNVPISVSSWIIQGLQLGFIVYSLYCYSKLPSRFAFPRVDFATELKANWYYFLPFVIPAILYFYKALPNWSDHDEITVYAYFSKLYAQDQLMVPFSHFSSGGPGAAPRLVEVIHSYFYYLSGSTFLSRNIQLISFIAFSFSLYQFLGLFKVKKYLRFLTLYAVWLVPELNYLLISLKVDFFVMSFELIAMTLFFEYIWLANETVKKKSLIIILSLVFSSFSVMSRMSGLYLFVFLFFNTAIFSWRFNRSLFGPIFMIGLIASQYYIKSLLLYLNPIYPMRFFSNPNYQIDITEWKGFYNLNTGLPLAVEALYLIIHVAFGFETYLYKGLNFLPHALHRGISMGWVTPTFIFTFYMPFLIQTKAILRAIFVVFLWCFICWVSGITYTRVFLAASLLPLLFMVVWISLEERHEWFKKMIITFIAASVLLGTAYHLLKTFKMYQHSFKIWATNEETIKQGLFASEVPLTIEDVSAIQQIIQRHPKAYIFTNYSRSVHVFFDNVLVDDGSLRIKNREVDCYLVDPNKERSIPPEGFVAKEVYQDKLYCR